MEGLTITPTLILAAVVVLYIISSIQILAEYERGVIFRLGKLLPRPKGPGVVLVFVTAGAAILGKLAQHLFPGRDCFPLPLRARLFVMLTLFQLGQNPRLLTLPLEAAKRILECLVFFDVYERHPQSPPSVVSWCTTLWAAHILGSRLKPVNWLLPRVAFNQRARRPIPRQLLILVSL